MPLQNRVAPDGSIHAVPHRGMAMGNRGIIHDPKTKTLLARRWTSKAWIICETRFKGRWRPVMAARSWTELFFLDEVTALAAGHRPCFECRRKAAMAFAGAFPGANGGRMRAGEIDACLHLQRIAVGHRPLPRLSGAEIVRLPDGTVIGGDGQFFAVRGGGLLGWTFAGYMPAARPSNGMRQITPPAVVAALANGYAPLWHPSADACTS